MHRSLLLVPLLASLLSNAQDYYVNDFDGNNGWPELPVVIDTAAGTLWQIGTPQKAFFQSAYSPVNAIVTDTVDPCAAGNTSRFLVKLPVLWFQWWPEFFVQFQHAWDMDTAHAGGFIEISYDTGATWMNVFSDWINPPNVQIVQPSVGFITPDTLSNGQLGFTGRSENAAHEPEWVWTSFCWVQNGIPLPDTVLMRFTFYTDSLSEPRDGWMLDDLAFQVYIAHPISEYLKMDRFFVAAPNPMTDRLYINYDTDGPSTPVRIDLFDAEGRLVRTVVDRSDPEGPHNVMLWRQDLPGTTGPLLLRATIGDREHVERVLLAPAGP